MSMAVTVSEAEVLRGFPIGEPRESAAVLGDEADHCIRIDLRIVPQRPPDGFADEELGLVHAPLARVEEQVCVGGFFVAYLREDGRAPQPQIPTSVLS